MGVYKDNRPLKKDKVCSYRDEIAAVAATDPETAAAALRAAEEAVPLATAGDSEAEGSDGAEEVVS